MGTQQQSKTRRYRIKQICKVNFKNFRKKMRVAAAFAILALFAASVRADDAICDKIEDKYVQKIVDVCTEYPDCGFECLDTIEDQLKKAMSIKMDCSDEKFDDKAYMKEELEECMDDLMDKITAKMPDFDCDLTGIENMADFDPEDAAEMLCMEGTSSMSDDDDDSK